MRQLRRLNGMYESLRQVFDLGDSRKVDAAIANAVKILERGGQAVLVLTFLRDQPSRESVDVKTWMAICLSIMTGSSWSSPSTVRIK